MAKKYLKLYLTRKDMGISADDLSDLLGLKSSSNYSKRERGEAKISIEEGKQLAELFDMTIEELFFSEIENRFDDKKEEKCEKKIS
jgi:transcriptional regulator with XRE-family HTH domain